MREDLANGRHPVDSIRLVEAVVGVWLRSGVVDGVDLGPLACTSVKLIWLILILSNKIRS